MTREKSGFHIKWGMTEENSKVESEVYVEVSRILDFQRKKTTQKVNLYEKVQIPGYNEAIRKIKRYMEDAENLDKASQKIIKNKHAIEEEAEYGN